MSYLSEDAFKKVSCLRNKAISSHSLLKKEQDSLRELVGDSPVKNELTLNSQNLRLEGPIKKHFRI